MKSPDEALSRLKSLRDEFATFCDSYGAASEADTRAKLIERVLIEVCGWPESDIQRELYAKPGYMDLTLSVRGHMHVVVEAKREGKAFTLPRAMTQKSLRISGALTTDEHIREAVNQVRQYCDDNGVRYAIATNGYTWIVFRAIRENMPWREGMARIFPSLDWIIENFTEFWNLLSFGAICSASLDTEFGAAARASRSLHRVLDRLFTADAPLQRNRLHAQLQPLIDAFFADIGDHDINILKSCYIHSRSLRIVAEDLDLVITDQVPEFLKFEGTKELRQTATTAGEFGADISKAARTSKSDLFLILGGIGSGKSTFLKRYQRTVGYEVLSEATVWFHINFLGAPLDPKELEPFLWREVVDGIRQRYGELQLESRKNIKEVFAAQLDILDATTLSGLKKMSPEYAAKRWEYLQRWSENLTEYVPALLRVCREKGKAVVIFIDNVDQLSPSYQAQIFLLAERITRTTDAITIVCLREESYYSANVQRVFTAYMSRKFHIASPPFTQLIKARIAYARKTLDQPVGEREDILRTRIDLDTQAISDYLTIVENSIFEVNRNISRFIEALCFGDMRRALQMFSAFLVSGATDVDKMLRIYRREGSYFVAFHEFVKSVMLGDRRFYRESASYITNVFDCGAEPNSSHFTALRILSYLLEYRGASSQYGQGYVDLGVLAGLFEDRFQNIEDFLKTCDRLLSRQLIEADTRSTTSIAGASHVRVTSAGWYYARYLVQSFSYLDLVLQDTAIADEQLVEDLRRAVVRVDNLSDPEADKFERMQVRFDRVDSFLRYLDDEETREFREFGLVRGKTALAEAYLPRIRRHFRVERGRIEKRLLENREGVEEGRIFSIRKEDRTLWDSMERSDE